MRDKVFTRIPQREGRDLSNQRFSKRQTSVRPVTYVVNWSSPANHAGNTPEQLSEVTEGGGSESEASSLPTPPPKSRLLRSRLATSTTTSTRVSDIQEHQEAELVREESASGNEASQHNATENVRRDEYETRGDNADHRELETVSQSEEASESQHAEETESEKESESQSGNESLGSWSTNSNRNSRGNVSVNAQQKRRSTRSVSVNESDRETRSKRRRTAEMAAQREMSSREAEVSNTVTCTPTCNSELDEQPVNSEKSVDDSGSLGPEASRGGNESLESDNAETAESGIESGQKQQNIVQEDIEEGDESETENNNGPAVDGEIVRQENHPKVKSMSTAIRDNITHINVKNRISSTEGNETHGCTTQPSSVKKQNTLDMFFHKKTFHDDNYMEVDKINEHSPTNNSQKVLLDKIFSPKRRNAFPVTSSESFEDRFTEEEIDSDINMSFTVEAESTPISKPKKPQPKKAPRPRTPRKQPPADSTKEKAAGQSLYIWNGGVRGKKKGGGRVLDLDVILAMVEQIAGDYRAELRTVPSRKAIREFFKEFQDEMTDLIDSVEEKNHNYSKYLKSLNRVRNQQKDLMAAEQETREIELEAYKIQKQIPKGSEGKARAELNRAKELLDKYRQRQQGSLD